MTTGADIWNRFEAMLKVKAPALLAALRPPATLAELEAAEAAMSLRLPEDVRTAYLRHDGTISGDFPMTSADMLLFVPFNWWASLDEMVKRCLYLKQFHAENREKCPEAYPEPEPFWADMKVQPTGGNDKWIPIGLTCTTTTVFVDLDPAPMGNLGQLMSNSGSWESELIAPSFDGYLEMLIDHVHRGALIFRDGWIWTETDEHVYDWNRIG